MIHHDKKQNTLSLMASLHKSIRSIGVNPIKLDTKAIQKKIPCLDDYFYRYSIIFLGIIL